MQYSNAEQQKASCQVLVMSVGDPRQMSCTAPVTIRRSNAEQLKTYCLMLVMSVGELQADHLE
jgi:hypothetical protein